MGCGLCKSTYFEASPPFGENDKRQFGHSRDRRSDCVQVVIALVVAPEGLPLAYGLLPGNTADCTTLRDFLARIENQYGKARRVWVMDRGIPTEAVLSEMRDSDPPVFYLVGTPKGRLTRLEQDLRRAGQAPASRRRDVHLRAKPRPRYQRARNAQASAQTLWARLAKLSTMKLSREALVDEAWRRTKSVALCLATGRGERR